jgi:hypothetical protein
MPRDKKKRRSRGMVPPRTKQPKKVQRLYFYKGQLIRRERSRRPNYGGLYKDTKCVAAGKFSADQLANFKKERAWNQ